MASRYHLVPNNHQGTASYLKIPGVTTHDISYQLILNAIQMPFYFIIPINTLLDTLCYQLTICYHMLSQLPFHTQLHSINTINIPTDANQFWTAPDSTQGHTHHIPTHIVFCDVFAEKSERESQMPFWLEQVSYGMLRQLRVWYGFLWYLINQCGMLQSRLVGLKVQDRLVDIKNFYSNIW